MGVFYSKRRAKVLDNLCQKRNLSYEQSRLQNIKSAREVIEANKSLPSCSDDETEISCQRPFGVPSDMGYAAFDVWEHILLEHVSKTSDIKKLRGVCKMFQVILRGKYVQIMLPEIVMLIRKKRSGYLLEKADDEEDNISKNKSNQVERNESGSEGEVDEDGERVEEENDDEEEDELIFRLDPIVKNLRLVSMKCKKSIEDIHHLNLLLAEYPRPYLKLRKPKDLETVIATLESSFFNENKFFPSCVDLWEDDLDGTILFPQEEVMHFLRLVGKRITAFKYRSFHDTWLIYNRLRVWVEEMPNLEVLELSGMFGNVDTRPRLDQIQAFPYCPSLRSYQEGFISLPAYFVDRILMANPQIENVKVNESDNHIKLLPQGIRALRNVTSLECWPHEFLIERVNLPWKLNKLVFDGIFIPTVPFHSRDIFCFLNQFKETLEQLEIMVYLFDSGKTLDLPNVKTLKWKYHESFKSLNFILNMDCLEEFDVKVKEDFMKGSALAEKYFKIIGDESKSFRGKSVWEIFPCLERIVLRSNNLDVEKHEELRKMHVRKY